MIPSSMRPVAACKGVDIFAPQHGKFAFMKSPFAAHTMLSAVDIYPGGGFGDIAPSPVHGTVMDIREYATPTPFRNRDFSEYLIAIEQKGHVVKILHVQPVVHIGDRVSAGEPLGIFIHNGYFYFWNDPPLHVEVREAGDYIRASNNNRLFTVFDYSGTDPAMESAIRCRVIHCDERFALLQGDFQGTEIRGYELGGCLLDGIVPLGTWDAIGYFGLVGTNPPVPYMKSAGNRFMVSQERIKARISGTSHARALGFSLSFSDPAIKVIPLKYGDKLFNEGDTVDVRVSFVKDSEVKMRNDG